MTDVRIATRVTSRGFMNPLRAMRTLFRRRRRRRSPPQAPAAPYVVHIYENFHYMDASGSYEHGRYQTYDAAVQAAQRIVDEALHSLHERGMTADELFRAYTMFGEDPVVVPSDAHQSFSAWTYAKQRCGELT